MTPPLECWKLTQALQKSSVVSTIGTHSIALAVAVPQGLLSALGVLNF